MHRTHRLACRIAALLAASLLVRPAAANSPLDDPVKQYKAVIIKSIANQWRASFPRDSNNMPVETIHVHALVAHDGTLQVESIEPEKPADPLYKVVLQTLKEIKIPPAPKGVAEEKPLKLDLTFKYE